jgi:hypothetical protein
MRSVGRGFQDYFLKLAPDLSVFDLVEQYFYSVGDFEELSAVFAYVVPETSIMEYQSNFHRAMFYVVSEGELSLEGLVIESEENAEYTVFPYKGGQVIIGHNQDNPLKIISTTDITLIVGVAF